MVASDSSKRSSEPSGAKKDPHPCLVAAIEPGGWQADLKWDINQLLEGHHSAIATLLKDSREEQAALWAEERRALEVAWGQSFQKFENTVEDNKARLDASALKLQRHEQCLEETLGRYLKTQNLTGVSGAVATTLKPSEKELEATVAKLQAKNEERFHKMQEQSMKEVRNLLESHPVFAHNRRYGDGTAVIPKQKKTEVEESNFVEGVISKISEDSEKPDRRNSLDSGKKQRTVKQRLQRFMTTKSAFELSSAFLILANCLWMGLEAQIALQNHHLKTDGRPGYISVVDSFFTICFCLELGVDMWLQGKDFWRCPNLRINLLDVIVVVVQVLDFAISVYNISWLRAIRIVRLLNALRILKKVKELRHLRFLVAATLNSLESLAWIMIFMAFVLFVSAIFILQSTLVTFSEGEELDPQLMQHFGSVVGCMLTLFKAVTGGAPWDELLAPLEEISGVYTLMFIFYWMFVAVGCFNHFTAIFVENMKGIVRRDDQLQTLQTLHNKQGPFFKLRNILLEADREEPFSAKVLEEQMATPKVAKLMKALQLEHWTMVGVYQEMAMEAMGQVEVEEYVQALIKLQTKSEMLDLSSVMADNKRILRRLLAFMRFSEDHFNEIFTFLGMGASGAQRPALEEYLPDARDLPNRDALSTRSADLGGRQSRTDAGFGFRSTHNDNSDLED